MTSPSRAPSTAPVAVDIAAQAFDSAFSMLLTSRRPKVDRPPPSEHRMVLRSTTAYEVEFKIRSSNPSLIVCTPAAGFLQPYQSLPIAVMMYLFRKGSDGFYHPIDATGDNPKLKITAKRLDTRITMDGAPLKSPATNVTAPYDVVVAPFQENIITLPSNVVVIDDDVNIRNGGKDIVHSNSRDSSPNEESQASGGGVAADASRRQLRTPRKSYEMSVEPFHPTTTSAMLPLDVSPPAAVIPEPHSRLHSSQSNDSRYHLVAHPSNQELDTHEVPSFGPPPSSSLIFESKGFGKREIPPPSSASRLFVDARPATESNVARKQTSCNPLGGVVSQQITGGNVSSSESSSGGALQPIRWSGGAQRIHVVVRARPSLTPAVTSTVRLVPSNSSSWRYDRKSVGDEDQTFFFDGVFGPHMPNLDVCTACGIPEMIEDVVNGVNACILMYGQTNSGKTYTMFGPSFSQEDDGDEMDLNAAMGNKRRPLPSAYHQRHGGLFSFSLMHLFRFVDSRRGDSISMSFVEVYNEEVRDLLAESIEAGGGNHAAPQRRVTVSYDATNDSFALDGVMEAKIADVHSALNFMKVGLRKATFGSSHLNDHSSRAHMVCRIRLDRYLDGGNVKLHAELFLVDLAGSESLHVAAGGSSGAAATEAAVADILDATVNGAAKTQPAAKGKRTGWVPDFAVPLAPRPQSPRKQSQRETTSINLSLSSLKKIILNFSKQEESGGGGGGGATKTPRSSGINSSGDHRPSSELSATMRRKSQSSSSSSFVSFRESTLTKLLKSALCGNSRVLMICTVSLDDNNRRETKATLAFGTMAKSVPTAAVQNQTVSEAGVIRALKDENEQLKGQISKLEAALLARTPAFSRETVGAMTSGGKLTTDYREDYEITRGISAVGPHTNIIHVDAMLEAFELSESKLATLVNDTLNYLKDGCRVFVLDPTAASAASSAATGANKKSFHRSNTFSGGMESNSTNTTPRYRRQVSSMSAGGNGGDPLALQRSGVNNNAGGGVTESVLRLKMPSGRCGAELLTYDGKRQVRVPLSDVSRVVLGKNFKELRSVAERFGIVNTVSSEVGGSSESEVPIPTVVLYSKRQFSSNAFGSSMERINSHMKAQSAMQEPLLTFMCREERDLEAWVIAIARLAGIQKEGPITSATLFPVSVSAVPAASAPNSGFATARSTNALVALTARQQHQLSLQKQSSFAFNVSSSSSSSRSSSFISWDIVAMSRRFAYLHGEDPSKLSRIVVAALRTMHEKEVLLCKQQNIDILDYHETKRIMLHTLNLKEQYILSQQAAAPPEDVSISAKLISLYDVRVRGSLTLYQAFAMVRLLKELGVIKERTVLLASSAP